MGIIRGSGNFPVKISAKKMSPPPKSLFENTMKNKFFWTPFFATKCKKKKKLKKLYSTSSEKCFWIWFLILGSAQTRKHIKYENMCVCVFSGSGTSQSLEPNPKAVFFYKEYHKDIWAISKSFQISPTIAFVWLLKRYHLIYDLSLFSYNTILCNIQSMCINLT